MPKIVGQNDFSGLSEIMENCIFLIPSFQRPYAWERKQLEDLCSDIIRCNQNNGFHYLAPIHLITLKPTIQNFDYQMYLDGENHDIGYLLESNHLEDFVDEHNRPLSVFLVIDGQQRLTTLYFVLHLLYAKTAADPLYVQLRNNHRIPRLIQNPNDDHEFMKDLLQRILNQNPQRQNPTSQAQRRLNDLADPIGVWQPNGLPAIAPLIRSRRLQSILVALDPDYALSSFLTLNDRGKRLTSLEKFKALLLEYDLHAAGRRFAQNIHLQFGDLYQILDRGILSGLFPKGEEADNRLMQYISVYIRIANQPNAFYQAGETAYEYFRGKLHNAPTNQDVIGLLNQWCTAIDEMRPQLRQLNNYLLGNTNGANQPSLICKGRWVRDDYNIIIKSLRLSARSIAMLLKFRHLYNVEWHQRFAMDCVCDPRWVDPLKRHLDEIAGRTNSDHVRELIRNIRQTIPCCFNKPGTAPFKCEISMLEVVERMELYIWGRDYNPQGGFTNHWDAVFGNNAMTPQGAVSSWYYWTWYQDDFPRFVQNDRNESIFRYILREYEAELNQGRNIHFDSQLQLEHIFPQNPDPLPLHYGFVAADEYRPFVDRIGNLTFVANNQQLGIQLPQAKAPIYQHANYPSTTIQVGNQLVSLGADLPAYREVLLLRCTELAIFCLRRFNAH